MDLPNISILTPTYNRQRFIPLMMANIQSFEYPKEKLEWVIYDDHPEYPLFESESQVSQIKELLKPIKLNYIYDPKRHLSIGEKRNKLVKNAKYKICAFMDDDDVYFPSYLKHSVETMKEKKASLVSSNAMIFVYPEHNFKICHIQCESVRQGHEACMVFTKKHFNSMGGFPKSSQGEGAGMIDFNEKNVAMTDIRQVMMCVAHKKLDNCNSNTIPKDMFLEKDTGMNLNPENPVYQIIQTIYRGFKE